MANVKIFSYIPFEPRLKVTQAIRVQVSTQKKESSSTKLNGVVQSHDILKIANLFNKTSNVRARVTKAQTPLNCRDRCCQCISSKHEGGETSAVHCIPCKTCSVPRCCGLRLWLLSTACLSWAACYAPWFTGRYHRGSSGPLACADKDIKSASIALSTATDAAVKRMVDCPTCPAG